MKKKQIKNYAKTQIKEIEPYYLKQKENFNSTDVVEIITSLEKLGNDLKFCKAVIKTVDEVKQLKIALKELSIDYMDHLAELSEQLEESSRLSQVRLERIHELQSQISTDPVIRYTIKKD